MGSLERSKKKVQSWKKATVQFLLCFVLGFFTGFASTNKAAILSGHVTAQQPVKAFHQEKSQSSNTNAWVVTTQEEKKEIGEVNVRKLVIVVTPTSARDRWRGVLLRRLANTLKLVAQPLLWIVVEQKSDDSDVCEILSKTGIMYRHVVFNENFKDWNSEMDHQRDIALNHIEHHRLSGIVHFAGLSNVYNLSFFEEIRAVEAFGMWPIANKKKVRIGGPVCKVSQVVNATASTLSSFAFNSSILWDPQRWGRTSSLQNALKFVREEVAKLKGIPADDCYKILIWHLTTNTL